MNKVVVIAMCSSESGGVSRVEHNMVGVLKRDSQPYCAERDKKKNKDNYCRYRTSRL